MKLAQENDINLLVSFLYQSQPATIDPLFGLDRMPHLFTHIARVSAAHRNQPLPSPSPSAEVCAPMSSILLCSVDGEAQNFTLRVDARGSVGVKTSSYQLPSGFVASLMRVEWTCQNDGRWKFTHPDGFCRINRTPACSPQKTLLTCSVNGVQQNLPFDVNASGAIGSKTNQFIAPSGYQVEFMRVEWTCQSTGLWQFSHPDGFCKLR